MPSPPFLYPVPRLTHPTYPPPAALRLRHRYRPIGQVISTAPVAAVAPATAVTELPCLHPARNVLGTGVLWMHL
jgi:hypothetical protein